MRSPGFALVSTLLLLAAGVSPATAEPLASPAALARPVDDILAGLPIPSAFVRVRSSEVSVDRERARLIRYERADDRNSDLGGEHVSVLIDRTGRLKGFARMDLALREGEMPNASEAERLARGFLADQASDLAPERLTVVGTAPHAQTVTDDDEPVTLSGVKVKMRNEADGRWLFVTIGADRQVMAFERDVVWLGPETGRQGEQWLSDGWLGRAVERLGRGA